MLANLGYSVNSALPISVHLRTVNQH